MMYFGIVLFLAIWLTTSAITIQNSYPTENPIVSADGLEYILRSAGRSIQKPFNLYKIPHMPSTFEQPPSPESYNYYMRDEADSQSETTDDNIEESFDPKTKQTLNYETGLPDYLKKTPKKYTSTVKQESLSPKSRNDFNPIIRIQNTGRMISLVFDDEPEHRVTEPVQILKKKLRTRRKKLNQRQEEAELNSDDDDDNDRVQYQMHGFRGPKTYKFGYDTGKGKDRQFRTEESDPDGRVKGHYGYINTKGKTIVVKYTANPEGGFRIEKVQ